MDDAGTIFLNLHPCRGHPFKAPPRSARDKGQITMCFYQPFEPLSHVKLVRGELWYNAWSGTSGSNRVAQRPLIAHANGMHHKLAQLYFNERPAKWETVVNTTEATKSFPVLLLDSPLHGVCNISRLADLQDWN